MEVQVAVPLQAGYLQVAVRVKVQAWVRGRVAVRGIVVVSYSRTELLHLALVQHSERGHGAQHAEAVARTRSRERIQPEVEHGERGQPV